MKQHIRKRVSPIILLVLCSLFTNMALGHGGVAYEEDLCVININFMQAHFTVFQPETRASDEFCEALPDVSRSVFVMEYLHELLPEMLVDFRIIRDVNEVGTYATWEDIQAIEDLEAATVYYEPPRIEEGGFFRASYEFDTKGMYIGIVTADHPTEDRFYNAVFFFKVGGPDYGTFPWFIGFALLLQIIYWLSSGGLTRRRERIALKKQSAYTS
ncbi:MAG: hypothetical protein COA96_12915 [SAR86 cluster bacterium]|uniref:Uncharacterized protein n=1 Tax=SAR86 cluster bacterium TaxID=2030880 RepID=A0A2A5AV53_9GAMM|nr:MAG: hypothetical protein COA96_12915 [SAR86 cluster bacterium]